jgi:hypothetical protein
MPVVIPAKIGNIDCASSSTKRSNVGAQRQTDTDFLRSLRRRIRRDAISTGESQQQSCARKREEKRHLKARADNCSGDRSDLLQCLNAGDESRAVEIGHFTTNRAGDVGRSGSCLHAQGCANRARSLEMIPNPGSAFRPVQPRRRSATGRLPMAGWIRLPMGSVLFQYICASVSLITADCSTSAVEQRA